MLQWTTLTAGLRFGMIIHHTGAEREYAYDRHSHFGRLDVALDLAATNHWTVVDIKRDWKIIFPFQKTVSGGGVAHWHPNNKDFQLAASH
jgi:hypothetical protein